MEEKNSMDLIHTGLSDVDGARGRLVVRGHSIDDLVGRISFEEMIALLWGERAGLPASLSARLGAARAAVFPRVSALLENAVSSSAEEGATALRVGLAGAGDDDALALVATVPVAVAVGWRRHCRQALLEPDPHRGHAEDFLRMLGASASTEEATALDAYLVTVAEHGMNASTYAARVVASTGAGLAGAVTAAFCALQGPLHGGAPGQVLDMLDAIGEEERAEAWLAAELEAGRRLMGFGHRIYQVRDPRADVLKGALRRLREARDSGRLRFAEAVERAALAALARYKPDRRLDTNVEFYTALLLEAVGLPRALFTPVFAMGRIAGWCGHVFEQRDTGRLIRPASVYDGPSLAESVGVG
jgi:citrate synthase